MQRTKITAIAATAVLALGGGAAIATAGPDGGGQGQGKSQGKSQLASKAQIAKLFDRWNASLATGDAEKVSREYLPGGILLPTISDEIRVGRASIAEYFAKDFLPNKPQGVITKEQIDVLDKDTATSSGNYDFTLTSADGKKTVVPARFTFVYEKVGGKWLIATQHSSAQPK